MPKKNIFCALLNYLWWWDLFGTIGKTFFITYDGIFLVRKRCKALHEASQVTELVLKVHLMITFSASFSCKTLKKRVNSQTSFDPGCNPPLSMFLYFNHMCNKMPETFFSLLSIKVSVTVSPDFWWDCLPWRSSVMTCKENKEEVNRIHLINSGRKKYQCYQSTNHNCLMEERDPSVQPS